MRTTLDLKRRAAVLFVLVSLLLGVPVFGHAGEESPPAPGAEHLYGPAIEATLTLTDADGNASTAGLTATLSGNCRGVAVGPFESIDPNDLPFLISQVTVQSLENRRAGLPTTGNVPECGYPFAGQLIITSVSRLTKTTLQVVADVVILAVRPLP